MQRKSGFTLVEIMIVVAIIAMLVAVAMPSFMRARKRAQNTRFIAAAKVASEAFQIYAVEHAGYPADTGPAQVPDGMAPYFGKLAWTQPTPIGGSWDWDYGTVGVKAAISAYQPSASDDQRLAIDEMIDDGNSDSGIVRVSAGRVTYVVEE
jgi:prepilin-type N-terminal cleavage/methylation domain-containing protein